MDAEFHYYVTWFLAQEGGFNPEDCATIAYASQYTDDNNRRLILDADKPKEDRYEVYPSQTMNILKPKLDLMRIYACFHFVPGNYELEAAQRKDGKMHILGTTPDNRRARKLISEAFATKNLFRMGIAIHAYADTWAHQNFVGWFDYFNGMGDVFDLLTPNIGHADAMHDPDIPGLIWQDERLVSRNGKISNKKRFLDAAARIYYRLRKHLKPKMTCAEIESEWKSLAEKLANAIGEEFTGKDKQSDERIKRYKALLHGFVAYEPKAWFNEAVKVNVRGLPDPVSIDKEVHFFSDRYAKKPGFEKSQWFMFQEAAKAHQSLAMGQLESLFEQMGASDRKEL